MDPETERTKLFSCKARISREFDSIKERFKATKTGAKASNIDKTTFLSFVKHNFHIYAL